VPYVRVTRDHRGYENTFLLHSPRPGERPRVLYWYRSAPGVRVGRPAFDEEAIRTLEERHPEIDFDWPQLLEQAATVPPEVERRPERPKRRRRAADSARVEAPAPAERVPEAAAPEPSAPEAAAEGAGDEQAAAAEERPVIAEPTPSVVSTPPAAPNPLLDQLVGREIAARLRMRYAELTTRIAVAAPDEATRAAWQARADALDPDRWMAPEEVLAGIERADRLYDELRREIGG